MCPPFFSLNSQLFLLEELRARKYHTYAQKIQRAYRRWKARKYFLELKEKCMFVPLLTILSGQQATN